MPASPSGSTSSTTVSSSPSTTRMFTLTQLLAPCRYWMTSAPMTAPMTDRRPPMNSMISSASSAVGSTSVSGTNCWVPAYTAPPRAANTQPSTNSSSFRRGVRTPSAAAVRSSTPSTNSSRPMSEVRMRAAMKTASASSAMTMRPPPTRATVVDAEDDGHSVPGSGAPTAPPRNPVPDT